jgi:signal peptidase II
MDSHAAAPAKPSRYAPLLLTAALVVALDQLVKSVMLGALSDGPVEIIRGAITLRLTYNSGGAFGLLQGAPGFFLVATLVVVGLILVWARNVDDRRWFVPLGLVLGGGVGNLIDRILRDTPGVIDFVDLHVWPVFNVADSCISIGVVWLLGLSLLTRPEDEEDPAGVSSGSPDAPR